MNAVRILGELVEATSHVTSTRALDRAIAEVYARHGCGDAEFRAAAAKVIAAAHDRIESLHRVAGVSRRAHVANRELRDDLDRRGEGELIARSPAMRAVLSRIEQVAKHPTTVLLLGESGTGKEVVAREIHRRSRGHRPMIQINCGALPEQLVEAELFGCERGAFTGAERTRTGVFERAHRSTLLLDEIGDLPLAAQAKLLRVLQERRVRRVGGEQEIEVDVRVIAATNRDLRSASFREDLLYRLDVFSIQLPPLRERRDDFAPLVAALVKQLADRLELPVPAIDHDELARLAAYDWPGNVRELMNVLERGLILEGHRFELPEAIGKPRSTLDATIRDAIEAALKTTAGKLYGGDGAAARLGIAPATLQSKMKKLGIARAAFVRR